MGEAPQFDWSRLPKQGEFLTAPERFTLISGGFGSGKTTALCAKAILLSVGIPNNLGFIGRMDGKALRASTMQSLYDMLPVELLHKRNDQQGFIQFKKEYGGSKIIYGDLKDIRDFKNVPLGWFALDQAEEAPKQVWDFLVGRLRRRTPILDQYSNKRQYWVYGRCGGSTMRHYALHGDTTCRVCHAELPPFAETYSPNQEFPDWDLLIYNTYGFAASNPEGTSHWLFQMFAGLDGQQGTSKGNQDERDKADYRAFQVTLYDGLQAGFVPAHYVRDLENLYRHEPLMWDRYILGKWVEAEGLIYPSWNRAYHLFHSSALRHDGTPILLERGKLYEYVDHGLSCPTAVGWIYVEPCECGCGRHNYFLLDEHYEGGQVVSYHALQIMQHRLRFAELPISATYLDSQAFSKTLMSQNDTATRRKDELYSVSDEYMDHQIFCVPNQKDWDVGHNRIKEALAIDPTHIHPITGERGAPHLLVADHCKYFIWEIETYKWKVAKNVVDMHGKGVHQDEPVDGNDNHMDGLNGFFASRPEIFIQFEIPTDDGWDVDKELAMWSVPSSHMSA